METFSCPANVGIKGGDVREKHLANLEALHQFLVGRSSPVCSEHAGPRLSSGWVEAENYHGVAGFPGLLWACPGPIASISRPEQDVDRWGCFLWGMEQGMAPRC